MLTSPPVTWGFNQIIDDSTFPTPRNNMAYKATNTTPVVTSVGDINQNDIVFFDENGYILRVLSVPVAPSGEISITYGSNANGQYLVVWDGETRVRIDQFYTHTTSTTVITTVTLPLEMPDANYRHGQAIQGISSDAILVPLRGSQTATQFQCRGVRTTADTLAIAYEFKGSVHWIIGAT
jgi:hypothetical protein